MPAATTVETVSIPPRGVRVVAYIKFPSVAMTTETKYNNRRR